MNWVLHAQHVCELVIIFPASPIYVAHRPYLRLKYQLKANALTSLANGVGTSPNPGLATGWRRYTAEHILWCTSRYRGMNAKALMYGRGRQGVAYGFVTSTGLSRASANALRRTEEFSGVNVSGFGGREPAFSCEDVIDDGGAGVRFNLWVSSWSWASSESVKLLDCWGKRWVRDSVFLRRRWKERRSCFRFPLREDEDEDVRRVRAWERRDWRVSFGLSSGGSSGGPSWDGEAEEGSSGDLAAAFSFLRAFRPARRSRASLGAPVAKRTRSGSTWNMSPGLS